MEILRCNTCGKVLYTIKPGVVDTICCGRSMEHLVPNSVGTTEKHIPTVIEEFGDVIVTLDHPNDENHHIEWIALETDKGISFQRLDPPYIPRVVFKTNYEKIVKVYVYCNLHGLWER